MACKPVFKIVVSIQLPVTSGVKQGCVLSPTMFSMVFTAMLTDVCRERRVGVDIHFQANGNLITLQRL